jgi:hypothetical protein
VIAADSRVYSTDAYSDDACKISAFGNSLIFAASGLASYKPPDGSAGWDTHAIAKAIFVSLSQKASAEPMPLRLGRAWVEEVKNKLKQALESDRRILSLQDTDDNKLTTGWFVDFNDGVPFVVTAQVTYAISADGHITTDSSVVGTPGIQEDFLGRSEMAEELYEQKTYRSKQWMKELVANGPPGGDTVSNNAIRTVKNSIENYPKDIQVGNQTISPIGGPIDAIKLRRLGGIEWIQRKPNCHAN